VDLNIPHGLLNPYTGHSDDPAQCAAVAGGNVETSQRIVDVFLGALGLAAASQGTMNNVLFGDETFGYYETICGGAGATSRGPGASAVHTHMTNTRLTDPEVLESRYPVRVRHFGIRVDSGGAGRLRGGDGVVREIEFLQRLELSIISQRRGSYAPFGLAGGGPGRCGRNRLRRADGNWIELGGLAHLRVEPGDTLVVETPGGGGCGTE
jgi:5-oxoprolinase (ATP-hydrolysing)